MTIRRKVKRTLAITSLAAIVCFLMAGSAVAAELEINQTASDGKQAVFAVSVNNAPNEVAAFGFEVLYDSDVLRYKDYERGSLAQDAFSFFDVNEPASGQLRVGGMEVGANKIQEGSSGTLVILTFEVVGRGKSEMKLAELKDSLKTWTTRDE
ncbi:cohesin domain-containing protein [Desulfococcaceae bacterium HSG8]|nr:cohesin domain-containing protein [Desulfococcaceae bacterium HSG8]